MKCPPYSTSIYIVLLCIYFVTLYDSYEFKEPFEGTKAIHLDSSIGQAGEVG